MTKPKPRRGVPTKKPDTEPSARVGAEAAVKAAIKASIDLTAPVGTPVHPIAPDRVAFSGLRGGRMGNEVIVGHPDGTTSAYMHLNGQQMPRTGARVTPGNVIGQVGRTGNVPPRADSHLHLSVFDRNGKPLVPNIQSQPRVLR